MSIGVVKFFDNKKGFGFIKWAGEDLFVHYSDIISDQEFKRLETGDNVSFEKIDAPRGPQAKNVKIIEWKNFIGKNQWSFFINKEFELNNAIVFYLSI